MSDHNSVKMDLSSDSETQIELILPDEVGESIDDSHNVVDIVDAVVPAAEPVDAVVSVEPAEVESSDSPAVKSTRMAKKLTAASLVSYLSDDAEDEEESEKSDHDVEVNDDDDSETAKLVNYDLTYTQLDTTATDFAPTQLDLSLLPPEPPGKCSMRLQDKVDTLYKKIRREGLDMNVNIQNRKDFRNPSIYEKLIDFCGIDEKGTNYPAHLYNQSIWGPESYYDELAKAQKLEMDKREKERKERTKIEFVTGTKKTAPTDNSEAKKKSKWDTQSAVTTAPTTVIPAVGAITKSM